MSTVLDVDDTSGCPISDSCDRCFRSEDLAVATYSTPVGVFCETVCAVCVDRPWDGRMSWRDAIEAVLDHCGHLDCTVDEMADAIEHETTGS